MSRRYLENRQGDCEGDGALPLDEADEGHDDPQVPWMESDRFLASPQVVAEAAIVDGEKLGNESESIASEGLEGHWVIGRKAAARRRDGQDEERCNEGE
jgi:hypothetical protein